MQAIHSCFTHSSYLSRHVNINLVINHAREPISCKVVVLTLCACVHTPQYILLVQRAAEPCPACHAVSDLSVVVVGLLWGLAGYWQHPSMGRR